MPENNSDAPYLPSRERFLQLINSYHVCSGATYREIEEVCEINFSYLSLILKGTRQPSRDVLIRLCHWGWRLNPADTDEVLMLAGFPPLSHRTRREWLEKNTRKPSAQQGSDGAAVRAT
jgi:transcriptional regulator with XRE-family HTH domain